MNSTVITPKLSSALLWIFLTPLIAEICSSIGSMTSRSTVSGDAPGYGIGHRHDRRRDIRELVGLQLDEREDAEHHQRQHA